VKRIFGPHETGMGKKLYTMYVKLLPGRADIEGSKSNVAMKAWRPQAKMNREGRKPNAIARSDWLPHARNPCGSRNRVA
jgi:hypothetical protein